jgi:hypothetical protein
MSPSAAGVAGKPRIQRPGKLTFEETKGKGKDDTSWPAPSYLPVQKPPFDSDSEGACTVIALVQNLQLRIGHWTMNAHYCNDTQSSWSKSQPANGEEARYSGLAFMCLAEDDLVGSQLSLGTPTSLPRDKVVSNSLSLYSSLLALQTHHASSSREHDKIII